MKFQMQQSVEEPYDKVAQLRERLAELRVEADTV
jgi:ribosomal protein L29